MRKVLDLEEEKKKKIKSNEKKNSLIDKIKKKVSTNTEILTLYECSYIMFALTLFSFYLLLSIVISEI